MLFIRLYATDIDYNTVVEAAMPYIAKELSDKDNMFCDILKNIISTHGKPSGLSKLLIKALPNKNKKVASILPHFDEALIELMNRLLAKNCIAAKVTSLTVQSVERSKDQRMLKVEIAVDNIDYERTAAEFFPTVIRKLSDTDHSTGKLVRLMAKNQVLIGGVISAAIEAIPQQQRDMLLADIMTEYRKELLDILNQFIAGQHIKAEIKYMKVICQETKTELG